MLSVREPVSDRVDLLCAERDLPERVLRRLWGQVLFNRGTVRNGEHMLPADANVPAGNLRPARGPLPGDMRIGQGHGMLAA
jgi:hypothetical protein